MNYIKRLLICFLGLTSILLASSAYAQAIINPQCPTPPGNIWIKLVERPPLQGSSYINLNFEDYAVGVLEGEMSPLPGIARFEDTALQAGSVIIRTWGAYFCKKHTFSAPSGSIQGLCDTSSGRSGCYDQEYNPGHSEDSFRYSQQVTATRGIYLTYNNILLDAEYRARNGDPTNPLETVFTPASYPYLRSVRDPVAISETRSQSPSQSVGFAQNGAQYWASGVDPTSENDFHPRWDDYAQTLVHYYTNVHLRTADSQNLTPTYRWVALHVQWGTENGRLPLVMSPGEQITVTVLVQNTGTAQWTNDG